MRAMLVLMGEKEQNLKVTSVVLEGDPNDPTRFSLFHCPKCTNKLIQHAGHVAMILPGGTKTLLPIVVLCPKCSTRYLFNTSV